MKPPSKNIASSLRAQRPGGRGAEVISADRQKGYAPSMVVPGEGGTSAPPAGPDRRADRSAAIYADANGKRFGG